MIARKELPYFGGFVLTGERFTTVAHFSAEQLPGGLTLWTDGGRWRSVAGLGESDNYVVVLGHWAYCGDVDVPTSDIADHLLGRARESLEAMEAELDVLTGRYVVIAGIGGRTYVYNDALGNRTVYYATDAVLVSSHINLIAELSPRRDNGVPLVKLQWTADTTKYESVRNLLPNFRLDVASHEVARFFPREANRFTDVEVDALYDEVERIWDKILESYLAHWDRMHLSISGGEDSKFIMAMSRTYWDRLPAYSYGISDPDASGTQAHNYYATMKLDRRIVDELVALVDYPEFSFFDVSDYQEVSGELRGVMEKNSAGRHGQHLVAMYRENFPGDGQLNIRGNAAHFMKLERHLAPTFKRFVEILQARTPLPVRERLEALGYDAGLFGWNLYFLAEWELRCGKWLSEIQNEQDVAWDTLVPMGTRRLLEIVMALPEEFRANRLISRDLINRRAPLLNFVGANTDKNLYEQYRELVLADYDRYGTSAVEVPERVRVRHQDGTVREELHAGPTLSIPGNLFAPQVYLDALLFVAKQDGRFEFDVVQPYFAEHGEGNFEWRVAVNDAVLATLDGAEVSEPVHVSVDGLRAGDEVSLQLHALKKRVNDLAWVRATRTTVVDATFIEGEQVAPQSGAASEASVTLSVPGRRAPGVADAVKATATQMGALSRAAGRRAREFLARRARR